MVSQDRSQAPLKHQFRLDNLNIPPTPGLQIVYPLLSRAQSRMEAAVPSMMGSFVE